MARKLAGFAVGALRLNQGGFLRTEFVQAIRPVTQVRVGPGPKSLRFRCGHGRLLWRAQTFYTEEPDTVRWLDSMGPDDILWDVGANVGMYSVYAAKVRGCRVYAFEPEAQNYALLVDNIALNGVGGSCFPACVAVAGRSGFGWLGVRYLTMGGAWNDFTGDISGPEENHVVEQSIFGTTLDDLITVYGFPQPTHLKIDVDGLEPDIVDGAPALLELKSLRSVLIEIDTGLESHKAIPDVLAAKGFAVDSETPTGQACHPGYIPTVNVIFNR